MFSAVVFMRDHHSEPFSLVALSRSLGSLVGASIEGLIRDVIIAGPSGLELATIAEHAGCGFVEGEREAEWLAEALSLSKAPACVIMRAGYIPGPGFVEELRDIYDRPGLLPGFWRAEPEHWASRLFSGLAPVAGLVASRDQLGAALAYDFHRMTRMLHGRNLRTKMHRIG
jgi:hypothetical protein